MPSNKATAAAPIATGVVLAGTTAREVAQYGLEIWMTLALTGGLSAVAVGLGVLTGLRGFASDDDRNGHHDRTTVALAGLALTSIAAGTGIALAETIPTDLHPRDIRHSLDVCCRSGHPAAHATAVVQ
jgi:hypothetical protein